ncbi:MAG: Holliday junction branch migration protein RuvA, partial [Bacteroidota bacterium]
IILDLKDKMAKESGDAPISVIAADNTLRQEALSALVALGFSKIKVQKVLNQILREQPNVESVEVLIKRALKKMS